MAGDLLRLDFPFVPDVHSETSSHSYADDVHDFSGMTKEDDPVSVTESNSFAYSSTVDGTSIAKTDENGIAKHYMSLNQQRRAIALGAAGSIDAESETHGIGTEAETFSSSYNYVNGLYRYVNSDANEEEDFRGTVFFCRRWQWPLAY